MNIEIAQNSAVKDCFTRNKDFIDYKGIKDLLASKSFIKLSTNVFDKILASKNFTPHEKLFLVLVEAISEINLYKTGNKVATNSAQSIATMLGISRRTVFIMQKRLVEKGAINVDRSSINSQHERNSVSIAIEAESNNKYIPINLSLLKTILSLKTIKPVAKILWLYCYKRSHIQTLSKDSSVFYDTINDIGKNISSSEDSIRRAILLLEQEGMLISEKSRVDRGEARRKDKLLILLGAALPSCLLGNISSIPNRKNLTKSSGVVENENSMPENINEDHHEGEKDHLERRKRSPLININNNKNIINRIIVVDKNTKDTSPENQRSDNEIFKKEFRKDINSEEKSLITKLIANLKEKGELSLYEKLELFVYKLDYKDKSILRACMINQRDYYPLCKTKEELSIFKEAMHKVKFLISNEKGCAAKGPIAISDLLNVVSHQAVEKKKYFADMEEAEKYFGNTSFLKDEIYKAISSISKIESIKIKNYILKMQRNGDIDARLHRFGVERLIDEALCFASSWNPSKKIESREERNSFLRSVIGNSLAKGTWKTPMSYLNAERADIQHNQKIHQALTHGVEL